MWAEPGERWGDHPFSIYRGGPGILGSGVWNNTIRPLTAVGTSPLQPSLLPLRFAWKSQAVPSAVLLITAFRKILFPSKVAFLGSYRCVFWGSLSPPL